MGLVTSILSGLLGGVVNSARNDATSLVHSLSASDSWVLKTEKLLSYLAFIMGAAGPGQVIFIWMYSLIDGISLHFFGVEYRNNPLLFNGVAFILSNFGGGHLNDVWEMVRGQSLCLVFNSCSNPGLQRLSKWKKEVCAVSRKEGTGKQSGCEQFFNEIPLIVLGLVMGGLFLIVKYYNIGQFPPKHGALRAEPPPPPQPGPGDNMTIWKRGNQSNANFDGPQEPSPTGSSSEDEDGDDAGAGDGSQPLDTFCINCGAERTLQILRPAPIYCCGECRKRSNLADKENLSPKCAALLKDLIESRVEELTNQILTCLCPRCRCRWRCDPDGHCDACPYKP